MPYFCEKVVKECRLLVNAFPTKCCLSLIFIVESFGSSGPREMYEKAPILRGGGGFFSKRRYELVDKYPTYEERRPKIGMLHLQCHHQYL